MKMDEHARAWAHEYVAGLLASSGMPPEQRSSLHWEILSHLHEAAERRVEARRGDGITLADLQAVVAGMGGREGLAQAFLQNRVAATPRADFGRRLVAFLIDVALAFAAVALVFMLAETVLDPLFGRGTPFERLVDTFLYDFAPLWMFGLFYLYLVFMEMRTGATIGKMAFKLRTIRTDGRPLTAREALIRNVAKAFPPLLVLDGLLYLLAFRADEQRASDRIADTVVIDTTRTAWAPHPIPPPPRDTWTAPRDAGADPTPKPTGDHDDRRQEEGFS